MTYRAPAAKYIENETQLEVAVEAVFAWAPFDQHFIVTYPTGRRYALPVSVFVRHFTIVVPQEVFMEAYGALGDDRPTQKQAELDAQAMREQKNEGG